MSAHGRETQIRNFVEEVWNKGNYEAAGDLYAETYVNGFGTGPAARVEPVRRYHQAFPDLRLGHRRHGGPQIDLPRHRHRWLRRSASNRAAGG